MDRVKDYFNKPCNRTVMYSADPISDYAHAHLCMVYWTLFNTSASLLFGAYLHMLYGVGGWITTLELVTSILLLTKIQPWRELPRLILLLIAAYAFGASIGPLINFIVVVDQSNIVTVFAGTSVFFWCYSVSAIYNTERAGIYRIGEFLATITIPTCVVLSPALPELNTLTYFLGIAILCDTAIFCHEFIIEKFSFQLDVHIQVAWIWFLSHHFSFDLWDLLFIYLSLWPFILHVTTHSQECVYIFSHGETYFVSHTIALFTSFPALTAPRYLARVILSRIWEILKDL